MNKTIDAARLSETDAHTELMKAHAELMKAQARLAVAEAIEMEIMNKRELNNGKS